MAAEAKGGGAEDIPEDPSAAVPSDAKLVDELEAKEVEEEEGAAAKAGGVEDGSKLVKGDAPAFEVPDESGALLPTAEKSLSSGVPSSKLTDDEYAVVNVKPDAHFDAATGGGGGNALAVQDQEDNWEEEEVEIHPEIMTAVRRLQGNFRMTIARKRVLEVVRNRYELVFDPETDEYFYYDKVTEQSQWTKPLTLRAKQLYQDSKRATEKAMMIQRLFRRKIALRRIRDMVQAQYTKEYDPKTGDFYYLHKTTGRVQWEKPAASIVPSVDVALDEDSSILLQKDKEIERLRLALVLRDEDIEKAKNARLEELEAERQSKKIVQELRGHKRTKDMDLWEPEHVCAWFTTIETMEKYCPAVIKNRVDGLLLLNMETQDFEELGITSKLHQRRLEVALKKYKVRFEMKQAGEMNAEEGSDSDFSDSGSETPSELAEEEEEHALLESEGEEQEVHIPSEDELVPTEEELLELEQDKLHMTLKTKFPGNKTDKPKVGDIVRCHFSVKLEDGQIVNSSRKTLNRPFEFVVGIGQVIRGWDRAILRVSVNERVLVTLTAHYGYGESGYPPTIPANSPIVLEIELLQVRKRPYWFKPLLQPPGLSQRPFCPDDYYQRGGPGKYEHTHSLLYKGPEAAAQPDGGDGGYISSDPGNVPAIEAAP